MTARSTAVAFAALIATAITIGCSGASPSPTSPSLGPSAPQQPPPRSTVAASVAIEDAFAIKGPTWDCSKPGCVPGPGYLYEVRFLVRELDGMSGATIKSIQVFNPNHSPGETARQDAGESCWRDELRVPPGGTLDTFYSDAGSKWLGYCYVGIGTTSAVSIIPIEVFFVDDERHTGSVATTITTFR